MNVRPVIEIQGMEEVIRELRRRNLDVQAGLEAICHAGAHVVGTAAAGKAAAAVAAQIEQKTTAKRATRVEVSVGVLKMRRGKQLPLWLEFGTRRHRIPKARKRGRKVLKIGDRYVRWVDHPGARARPWLRPAYDSSKGAAQAAMGVATKKALRA
jgi:hypothetical protein